VKRTLKIVAIAAVIIVTLFVSAIITAAPVLNAFAVKLRIEKMLDEEYGVASFIKRDSFQGGF